MPKMRDCWVPICRKPAQPNALIITKAYKRRYHSKHNLDYYGRIVIFPQGYMFNLRQRRPLIHNGKKP